jgi:hypothetical protein
MEGSEGFNIFGDPDELRERLSEMAEQMQSTQRVAWADNAIKLAIRIVFPESVTLVREAREGLS